MVKFQWRIIDRVCTCLLVPPVEKFNLDICGSSLEVVNGEPVEVFVIEVTVNFALLGNVLQNKVKLCKCQPVLSGRVH